MNSKETYLKRLSKEEQEECKNKILLLWFDPQRGLTHTFVNDDQEADKVIALSDGEEFKRIH